MRLDQGEQLFDQERGEPERRLIEDQELWLGHQSPADGQHLLFAAGERARALALPFGEARKNREHLAAVGLATRPAAAIGAEIEILAHGHVGENAPALRYVDEAARDDRRRPLALDRGIRKSDGAAPWPDQAGDGLVECRLSGAVGAQHGDDLALPHGEIHAPQDFGRAVAGVQAVHCEDGFRHGRFPPPASGRPRRGRDRPPRRADRPRSLAAGPPR